MPVKRRPPSASDDLNFTQWKARAAAELESRYDIRATTVAEKVWKRLFVQNLTPPKAAEQAQAYGHNPRSAAFRQRKR